MKWKYIRYRHFFFILPGCRDVHGQLHPHRGYHYIIHFVILFSYATASSLCRLFVASTAACCARRAAARSSLLTNPSWNACLRAYNDPSYPSLAAIIQCLTALWRRPLFHSKQPRLCLAEGCPAIADCSQKYTAFDSSFSMPFPSRYIRPSIWLNSASSDSAATEYKWKAAEYCLCLKCQLPTWLIATGHFFSAPLSIKIFIDFASVLLPACRMDISYLVPLQALVWHWNNSNPNREVCYNTPSN